MSEIWKIIRFGLVGGFATLTHMGVVAYLTLFTSFHPVISNTAAFLIAFGVSASGHIFFTFRVAKGRKRALVKFFIVAITALILSNILLALMLTVETIPQYVSQIAAIIVVPIVTYLASRFWAFRSAA